MAAISTPEEWRAFLIRKLINEQPRFETLADYFDGNHPLPVADQRYYRALRDIQRQARSNYYGSITRAPLERMRVKGFRFGKNSPADDSAKMTWSDNDMDYKAQYLLQHAGEFGRSYLLVLPPDQGKQWARMTNEDPRYCITEQDPLRPTQSLAGIKLWNDEVEGAVYCTLFLPGGSLTYRGPELATLEGMSRELLCDTLSGHQLDLWTLVDAQDNPSGICQLVLCEWQPGQKAEAEELIDIQDRLNLTMLFRLVISKNQSFRQRFISGVTAKKGRNGKQPPFDPGADKVWITANENAKFGDFSEADITQVLESCDQDINMMFTLSRTPAYYLMGKVANVSGDTIAAGEAGFIAKIRLRMASMGWGLEKAMKIALAFIGETEKANEVDAEVIWADPETHTQAELTDAAVKEAQVLATAPPFALALVLRKLGYSPDDIAFAMEEREKYQQEQDAKMQQQAEMAHAQNMEAAAAGAKAKAAGQPGSKPSNNSTSGRSGK
jgi:hypothetical protein